jgi:hypothetical protein
MRGQTGRSLFFRRIMRGQTGRSLFFMSTTGGPGRLAKAFG